MSLEITVLAPAKINLTLDVTGRREDGYHLIESVMQTVDVCDRVTIKLTGNGCIRLDVEDERIPADDRNTAYRAATAFFKATGLSNPGISIHIDKKIPMQAGMAGGSADAAGVLVALNDLTDARLDLDTLCQMGEEVGADVPFCVLGGTCLCSGTGTTLSPLSSMPDALIVVAKPSCGVSTAEAYRLIDKAESLCHPNASAMVEAISTGDRSAIGRELCNVFEQAMALPEVSAIRDTMGRYHPLGSIMTGSGSAVFALFEKKEDACNCMKALEGLSEEVFLCHPCFHGPWIKKDGGT